MSRKTAVHLAHDIRVGREKRTVSICGRLTKTKKTRRGPLTSHNHLVDCKHCREWLKNGVIS